jgi:ankyrin repeat protein
MAILVLTFFGGQKSVVKLLLEKFANIKAADWLFGNALQAASANDHERVVMLLLECGADLNSLNEAPGEPSEGGPAW